MWIRSMEEQNGVGKSSREATRSFTDTLSVVFFALLLFISLRVLFYLRLCFATSFCPSLLVTLFLAFSLNVMLIYRKLVE